jgi:hypothetical protein
MAEALPAGDMHLPNKALQLEWFYMSFHKEDRAKYVKSGQRLCDKMLKSVTEYFKNISYLKVAGGSLARKHKCQIKQHVRRKVLHELRQRFDEKVRHVTEQPHGGDDCHSRRGNKYYCQDYKWQGCSDSGHCNNYNKLEKNEGTGPLPIAATRHSSHARCTGRRASTPPRSATKPPRMTNVKFKTKNINTRCITTTRAIQVTTTRAVAPIHRSKVRTRHQPPAKAKNP